MHVVVTLFALLAVFALAGTVYWLIGRLTRRRTARRRPRWRCHDCRYLLAAHDDGVTCGHGGGRLWKTPVHISNCMDYERR
ncbi:MAG: hypothetical protein PVF43_01285 [Candidatus Eiseniibacteriota bacterium]|jgi:hypothetical protein